MAKRFDNVKDKVLETIGKRKSGYTAQELASKLGISLDYLRTQVKALRDEGKVVKDGGRVPTYKKA